MTIVINIRGTSGSGKSTVVRRVMELYPYKQPGITLKRKRPHGYSLGQDQDHFSLFVPGHYEMACGGCDTIKTVDEVYQWVNTMAFGDPVMNVLYEGIMAQDDVRRAVELDAALKVRGSALRVIGLTTPIEDCLSSIRDRREARSSTEPINPKNTVDRARRLGGIYRRLRNAYVHVEELDREAAFLRCCALLSLAPPASSGDE